MGEGGFYQKDEELRKKIDRQHNFYYIHGTHYGVATCRARACPCPRGAGEARRDYGELMVMVMRRYAEILGRFSIQDVGGTSGQREGERLAP